MKIDEYGLGACSLFPISFLVAHMMSRLGASSGIFGPSRFNHIHISDLIGRDFPSM